MTRQRRQSRTRSSARRSASALEAALAQLRPDHSAAIVLRYEEGLSFEEIGVVLGIPEVTARSHVHRARKELARLLTASGWAPLRAQPAGPLAPHTDNAPEGLRSRLRAHERKPV